MRHDIQPNERAFSTKEVAEEMGIATATVRRYGQILEQNGFEFFKDGPRRIFVRSDIDALIELRDTEHSQEETAKKLVEQQQTRLKQATEVAIPDTYDGALQDPSQLSEFFHALTKELAATREMNAQLSQDMDELKTKVARLQQDHHVISSGVGNFAQKTSTNIEKLAEQHKAQYESLLEQEKEKSAALKEELERMREDQKKGWQAQNEFNQQLEVSISKSKGTLGKFLDLFRK
ncbi:helix-turn-helix domain-containing protein [Thalassobacillus hwangdonensis]|uniref:Helix-turn-helix domain-containing protein n=1 Tax=Thalassobacillus hwangdonensis TaxID=546108 RepID=A0ABW3L049_9BACI